MANILSDWLPSPSQHFLVVSVALLVYGVAPALIGRSGVRRRLPLDVASGSEGTSLRQRAGPA